MRCEGLEFGRGKGGIWILGAYQESFTVLRWF